MLPRDATLSPPMSRYLLHQGRASSARSGDDKPLPHPGSAPPTSLRYSPIATHRSTHIAVFHTHQFMHFT
uniref:Uncharacterized protein n=1 Tax=Astyanax mexicanus TaxID=7994 RepID=A0A8B9HMP4_ASTMX